MKKHIAFYIGSLHKGGAERVFVNLGEYFYSKGYKVTMVTQYRGEEEYTVRPGIGREFSEISREEITKNRTSNFIKRVKKLRNIWKKIQPDIVLSCIGKNNFMALATAFGLSQKTVVSVVGEPTEEYYTKVMRVLAKTLFYFADGIVLQTTDSKSFFPKRIQKKAVILQNSVNPLFIRERFTGEREKRIVSVGRLDDNKNQEMIIRAFWKLLQEEKNQNKEYSDYELVLYGEGENRAYLEELVQTLHLTNKVKLPGITKDVAAATEKAAMFILSSYTEGMPNALIEAMCLGLPVISTDCPCGGPRELIISGENGFLIPVNDVEELTQTMKKIIDDPELSEKLGKNAAKIQERVNPKITNQCWENYFLFLLQNGQKRK